MQDAKTAVPEPTKAVNFSEKDVRRFMSKVEKSEGCWMWKGSMSPKGYGIFCLKSKAYRAHRISFMMAGNSIGEGKMVCHNCPGGDNRACVNPAHLFEGDALANNQDKVLKGTSSKGAKHGAVVPFGEKHSRAKIGEKDVLEIRRLFASKEGNHSSIGRIYGLTPNTVKAIVIRQTWKHVPPSP